MNIVVIFCCASRSTIHGQRIGVVRTHRPRLDHSKTVDDKPGICVDPTAWTAALPRMGLSRRRPSTSSRMRWTNERTMQTATRLLISAGTSAHVRCVCEVDVPATGQLYVIIESLPEPLAPRKSTGHIATVSAWRGVLSGIKQKQTKTHFATSKHEGF